MKRSTAIVTIIAILGIGYFLTSGDEGNGTVSKSTSSSEITSAEKAPLLSGKVKNIKSIDADSSSIVLLDTEVTGESMQAAIELLEEATSNNDEVYLVINSPGGSVLAGAKLMSYMEASSATINTVCEVLCASMGAQIHQIGAKRYMLDRSILMFHPASVGGLSGTLNEIDSILQMFIRYTAKMDAATAKRAGLSFEEFNNLVVKNIWIDAEDAVNKKLSDGIVSLNIKSSKLKRYSVSSKLKEKGITNVTTSTDLTKLLEGIK